MREGERHAPQLDLPAFKAHIVTVCVRASMWVCVRKVVIYSRIIFPSYAGFFSILFNLIQPCVRLKLCRPIYNVKEMHLICIVLAVQCKISTQDSIHILLNTFQKLNDRIRLKVVLIPQIDSLWNEFTKK